MFEVGDKVVYPMHGAGVIDAIESKDILGETKQYFVLRLPLKNMKVMLPIDNIEKIGLRDIISKDQYDDVIKILSEECVETQANWNRRYRSNMDKVKTGDIFEVAMVVRDLVQMDREKGLSTGERKMLSNTRQILVSELVLVMDSTEPEIELVIDEAIH